MAAYQMDILGELFPENTRRRHHKFKRSSDEYARKIAMKDIQAELRQNRKKEMADINYQFDTDKQIMSKSIKSMQRHIGPDLLLA